MKRSLVISSLILLFVSCETEIDLLLPPDNSAIVYSIFDTSDSIFEVRLSRSFQLEQAFVTDLIPKDSLIIPGARVWIERWNGDYMFSRNELSETERFRTEGTFPTSPNPVYKIQQSDDQNRIFEEYNSGDRVKLLVEIPGYPLVFSMIEPISETNISAPSRDGVKISLYREDKPNEAMWKTTSYYSEGYLELTAVEHFELYSDTVKYCWREFHSIPDTTKKIKHHSFYLKAPRFLERISANVRINPEIKYREIIEFKVLTYSTDKYLYDYNVAQSLGIVDHSGIPFSNIVNGMGLFASSNTTERTFILDYRSMDSLVNGRFTKNLKFRKW